MSNFKPATVVFSLPGSSSGNKFDKPLDELIKQDGNKPADIKAKKQNRLDIKGVVQKNVKENTKSKPARALNATKSENNPRLNKRAEDKKGRARPVFIVPPKKDEPVNKGAKFNRNNSGYTNNHSDEKVKIVVKNDQFGKKEIKKKESEPKERITIRVNRKEDEMMDSDAERDESPRRAPRQSEKKRHRSRDRSESDSDEEYKRRRSYSVNQVQPSPMYVQPQYSMPAMVPAPVTTMPRMYNTAPPGPHGVFQNILHSILKQNINERLDQTGLPPPPQPTMPVRSYGYPATYPVAQPHIMEPEPMQPLFADNDRSGGMTLSQRFGSSSSGKSSSAGTSKITVRLH